MLHSRRNIIMMFLIVIISILLFVAYAVLIIYYRAGWMKIPEYKPLLPQKKLLSGSTNKILSTRVTVIIPARNEEKNIGLCLRSISGQTYPAELFETIVVDDHSTDDTALVVEAFSKQNIRCIFLKDYLAGAINSYKKKAIEVAIELSTGELIVTTDADCYMGSNWLHTMACFYEEHQAAFIAAPVVVDSNRSFLSIFQALDFMTLQGITAASVFKKIHSMCNGANMAYQKKCFIEVGGFKGIDTIASGDDMLLMHKIFKRYPEGVFFLKSNEAIVHTQPMHNWKSFFNQRIRWASKADKYEDKRILPVLMIVYFFNLLLLLLPVMAIFFKGGYMIFSYTLSIIGCWFWLMILKTGVELYFLFPVAVFFGRRKILWWFPLAQPFHILYTVIAGWLGKFGSYQWKDRRVK